MARWYERDLEHVARARLSRRGFLGALVAGAVAACSGDDGSSSSGPSVSSTSSTLPRTTTALPSTTSPPLDVASDPFTLGVASGDPLPDGVVLWTRLAPDPLEPAGGMGADEAEVAWEVASDRGMSTVVASGVERAEPDAAHAVHVDVRGLEPDREYWYRFRAGEYATDAARTRTAPAPGEVPARLLVGHVSCSRFDGTFWSAYRDVAEAAPDLVVHCGDYIYERGTQSEVRTDPLDEAIELDDYRARYALYRTDAQLQAAHAVAPWLVTWDDHEVENNYTSDAPEPGSDTPEREEFLARRAAAYRAWWEHMPVRLGPPSGPDLPIYRSVFWGALAAFHVLDTRQYRTDQICGENGSDIGPRCDASFGADYMVLGSEQEAWLDRQLAAEEVAWSALVQQIVLQQWRFAEGNVAWNLDQWDGYPAARDRLLASLVAEAGSSGNVVLTGDVHSSWAGSLALDFDDPASELVGTEFVAPGVGSPPNSTLGAVAPTLVENNPHIAWAEGDHRGWLLHEITPQEWRTQFRLVDDFTQAGSPLTVASEWSVPAGASLLPA